MTSQALILKDQDTVEQLVDLVKDGITSEHTERAYARGVRDFAEWYVAQGRPQLTKRVVDRWVSDMTKRVSQTTQRQLAPATVHQRISAVRKLVRDAGDDGLLGDDGLALAEAVGRVKGPERHGQRMGVWLTQDEAQRLLDTPNRRTVEGKRDGAVLAVLLGCWLRRDECARLEVSQIRQIDGRWAIVDLVGKKQRVRTVPMPAWVKVKLDDWLSVARITDGCLFRRVSRGGSILDAGLSGQAIADVVDKHATAAGLDVAAHDLRRTGARLAHRDGAPIEQISLCLGHGSIRVTQIYLGIDLELSHAATDYVRLR